MVGWTATVRNVSDAEKKEVAALYTKKHQGWPTKNVEYDHFISLELGGSNDPRNIWPEPYTNIMGGQNYEARQKDVVENYLHRQVIAGKMTLEDAQKEITTDWVAVYKQIKSQKKGVIKSGN